MKYFFSNYSKNKSRPSKYLPDNTEKDLNLFENYNKKVIKPTKIEIKRNYPSRSAKLRYAVRSKNKFFSPLKLTQKFNKYLDVEGINV